VSSRHASNELSLKRFEREARSAAKLRSSHIAQVYDYGVYKKSPYMVMELLSGESLSKRLKREGTLSLRATVRIGLHLARALATAHENKVVHRDLKPGNVFLVIHQDEDIAKVFDFGIAKALETIAPQQQLTQVGTLLGTPHYMAPEQVMSATEAEPRSDLWSLAVILYRICVGRIPFKGDSVELVLGAILHDPAIMPSELEGVDLPIELDAFFTKALAKDPSKRFGDAIDLIDAFAEAAGYERSMSQKLGRRPVPVRAATNDADPSVDQSAVTTVLDSKSLDSKSLDSKNLDSKTMDSRTDGFPSSSTLGDPPVIPIQRTPASVRFAVIGGIALLVGGAITVSAIDDSPSGNSGSVPSASALPVETSTPAEEVSSAASATTAPPTTEPTASAGPSAEATPPEPAATTQVAAPRPTAKPKGDKPGGKPKSGLFDQPF
jgi:serine/threonine protein kinase